MSVHRAYCIITIKNCICSYL